MGFLQKMCGKHKFLVLFSKIIFTYEEHFYNYLSVNESQKLKANVRVTE